MPLVDEPHCKAWQEFRRLIAERQWSLAFRAVADDLENPPDGLLPAEDGFSREWRKQVHQDFGALDAEGRRAFELFFGGRARKLVDDARDDRDPGLATAFYAYGLTVAGTRAGDRIAAAALQARRETEAVEIWEWVLKSGATAGYDPRKVRLGLGAAFARLGWASDFDRVAAALEARWGDDVIEDDGAPATVKERVARARASLASGSPAPSVRERLEMPDAPVIAWNWEPPRPLQDDPARNMHGWAMAGISGRAPDGGGLQILVEGATAYSSDGKRIRAIDTTDGSIRWNRAHHTPGDQALTNAWILPDGDRLFVEEMGETTARSFSCRGAADGVERWTADLQGDGDCLGPPLLDGDEGYVVARGRESQHVTLCAIDLANGKKRWTLDLGTPISGTGRGMNFLPPEFQVAYIPDVRLVKSGTHVVLMTEGGLALAVDSARRKVAWAALLAPVAGGSGRLRVRQEGSIAYATFLGGSELVALDLDRAKVCWRRRIDGGADLAAMDRRPVLGATAVQIVFSNRRGHAG